jgi:hypothetical protein
MGSTAVDKEFPMFLTLSMACGIKGTNLLKKNQSGHLGFRLNQCHYYKYAGWVILTVYLLFLICLLNSHNMSSQVEETFLRGLHNSSRLIEWIAGFVLSMLVEFALFTIFGFLVTIVIPRGSDRLCWTTFSLPALIVSSILTVIVHLTKLNSSSYLVWTVDLSFPLLGCIFGTWAGTKWLCGWRARLSFMLKVVSLCFLTALGMALIVWLSLEEMPLSFEANSTTSVEKRRLADLIRGKNPGILNKDQTHTVRLTEYDINVLLSWVISLIPADGKAKISLDRDCVSILNSTTVSIGKERPRYLNLNVTGGVYIKDGVLNLRVDRCWIGSQKIPHWLLPFFCTLITSRLNHDPQLRPFLHAVEEIAIMPDCVQFTYRPMDLPSEFRKNFLRSTIPREELISATRAQVDHLLILFAVSPQLDPQPSFNLCLSTTFALARRRSFDYNPVVENQAAILALGMLLGHPRIETLIGPILTDIEKNAAKQAVGRVVLRGRSDLARHFCVSAAIFVLSTEAISDSIGLLKEKLDADVGGSGFSFVDLLADRAGTTFALSATHDEAAARAMQNRLACGFHIENIFPAMDGLPEGVSDAELQSCYGGVGGESYCRLIEEIKQRVAACAAYH